MPDARDARDSLDGLYAHHPATAPATHAAPALPPALPLPALRPAVGGIPGVPSHAPPPATALAAPPQRHPMFRVVQGGAALGPSGATTPLPGLHYPFTQAFAQALAYRLATDHDAWATLGQWVRANAFPDPGAALIVEACAAIARERGNGPSSSVLVLQRIQRWVDSGQQRPAELSACAAVFGAAMDAEDAGAPWLTTAEVIAEAQPLLLAQHRRETAVEFARDAAAGNSLAGYAERILAVEGLGVTRTDIGAGFDALIGAAPAGGESTDEDDAAADAEIARLDATYARHRIPLGLPEVDYYLGGGAWRRTLAVIAGGTGGAKSMALIGVLAATVLHGPEESCLYATCEMEERDAQLRLMAHLSGVALADLETPEARVVAARYLRRLRGRVGDYRIRQFPDGEVTVADLESWVKDYERATGRKVTRLIVDGIDHLSAPRALMGQRDGDYQAGKHIMRGLERLAQSRDISVVASSHTTRGKAFSVKHADGTPLPSKDDLAESQHRAKVAHIIVTLAVRADPADPRVKWTYMYFAKNRFGVGEGAFFGPAPADLAHARVLAVTGSGTPTVLVNGVPTNPHAPPVNPFAPGGAPPPSVPTAGSGVMGTGASGTGTLPFGDAAFDAPPAFDTSGYARSARGVPSIDTPTPVRDHPRRGASGPQGGKRGAP